MNDYEDKAKIDLAESCAASVSIEELVSFSEDREVKATDILDLSATQDYSHIRGTPALRANLARLYSSKVGSPLAPDNILIQPGAIAANQLVLYALLQPGDHVICHYPTYQQLYSVPASLGAEVSLWKSDPTNDWLPDLEQLASLVKDNTKLIIIKFDSPQTAALQA